MEVRRGDILLADLNPVVGTEQSGIRLLLCEQIRVIDKRRLIRKIGELSKNHMERVAGALRIILGI